MIGTALKVIMMAFGPFVSGFADREPFCYYPKIFKPSMIARRKAVDIDKYMGKWYDISHKEAGFQDQCECSTANYTFDKAANEVKVNNKCLTKEGKKRDGINGYAVPLNDDNTHLEVHFTPIIAGNYWILHIDEDENGNYQHVIVGEPCKLFLWFLSRTETISDEQHQKMIAIAEDKGFDTSNMIQRPKDCKGLQ